MLVPTAPNDRWSLDFVSDQLTDCRRFRFPTIVDDCTRESLALVASTTLSGIHVAGTGPVDARARQATSSFVSTWSTSSQPTISAEDPKTLKRLTPYEFICKAWASQLQRFSINPLQQSQD